MSPRGQDLCGAGPYPGAFSGCAATASERTAGQAAGAKVAARLCARRSHRLADAETAENARWSSDRCQRLAGRAAFAASVPRI